MLVLPPGSVAGTSPISFTLLKPRPAGIASSTPAPLPKVSSATRSLFWSKELMNVWVASWTADHCDPIELDTSRMSDRSTMRRVASPELLTVTVLKLATFMNVVGSTADAVTVTMLTPLAGTTVEVKKPGALESVTDVVPM